VQLLFLHNSTSLQQNISSETTSKFQKFFENSDSSITTLLFRGQQGICGVLQFKPNRIITNYSPTQSNSEYIFIVATLQVIRPQKPFSVVVTLQEETKHPVNFTLSILNNDDLLVPPKQTTLFSDIHAVVTFNMQNIPEDSDYSINSRHVVFAEYFGTNTSTLTKPHIFSFIPSQSLRRKLLLIHTKVFIWMERKSSTVSQ